MADEPSWMDAENDESHKAEIEPLFGTGQLPLQDANSNEQGDEEKPLTKGSRYGAILRQENDNDASDEEEHEKTVVSAASTNASSKKSSKGLGNLLFKKKKPKAREIVITETGKPEMPRRNCFMAAFHFLESVGAISSLALMGSQAIPLILIPTDELGIANICLKVYISLFCLLFVLVECDAPIGFLREASFLQAYFSRGFLYSFIGLSALEEAYSERVADMIAHAKDQFHVSWFSLFMQVSSWMVLSLGVIYMLFGLCCLKAFRDKVKQEHTRRWETYRDAMRIYRELNP